MTIEKPAVFNKLRDFTREYLCKYFNKNLLNVLIYLFLRMKQFNSINFFMKEYHYRTFSYLGLTEEILNFENNNFYKSENQLGYYLAGLIESDGTLITPSDENNRATVKIVFHIKDKPLVEKIKDILGYGSIQKTNSENAIEFVVRSRDGIIDLVNLINGKLRLEDRFNQVINNIINNDKYKDIKHEAFNFTLNSSNNFNNHWLAGFTDADGSFQIKIINRTSKSRPEIRLNYQIDQKNNTLLIKIKDYLGGNIGYRKSQDTYYYGSTSFGVAKNVINYFDRYNLQSRKHISYLR